MSISMPMDKPKGKTHPCKTKTSLFFSCFGYSKKVSLDKPLEAQLSINTTKRKRWFSWPRFRMKPSAIKTVPLLHHSSPNTATHCKYNKITKSKSKLKPDKSDHHTPPTPSPHLTQPLPQKDRHGDTNLGNAEKLDEANAKIDDTCPLKRLPSSRTNDNVKTALSRTSLRPAISNAVSIPVPGRHGAQSQVTLRKSHKSKKVKDSGFGISIVIMVIVIMVILCGRVYAILCTSAWFYFLPRLRMKENIVVGAEEEEVKSTELNISIEQLDLDSKGYKKKVILEGLLERNHRWNHEKR